MSTAAWMALAMSASRRTSAWTKVAPRRAAISAPLSALRAAMTTLAPSATNSSTLASPMPLVPPVITATLP